LAAFLLFAKPNVCRRVSKQSSCLSIPNLAQFVQNQSDSTNILLEMNQQESLSSDRMHNLVWEIPGKEK
jgi:hypothetical protein